MRLCLLGCLGKDVGKYLCVHSFFCFFSETIENRCNRAIYHHHSSIIFGYSSCSKVIEFFIWYALDTCCMACLHIVAVYEEGGDTGDFSFGPEKYIFFEDVSSCFFYVTIDVNDTIEFDMTGFGYE